MNTFVITDAGRSTSKVPHEKLDCVVRAFTTFTGMSYNKAWGIMIQYRNFRKRIKQLGWNQWIKDTYLKLNECKATIKQFALVYPKGRYMIGNKYHIWAMIDGKCYDTSRHNMRLTYFIHA